MLVCQTELTLALRQSKVSTRQSKVSTCQISAWQLVSGDICWPLLYNCTCWKIPTKICKLGMEKTGTWAADVVKLLQFHFVSLNFSRVISPDMRLYKRKSIAEPMTSICTASTKLGRPVD